MKFLEKFIHCQFFEELFLGCAAILAAAQPLNTVISKFFVCFPAASVPGLFNIILEPLVLENYGTDGPRKLKFRI